MSRPCALDLGGWRSHDSVMNIHLDTETSIDEARTAMQAQLDKQRAAFYNDLPVSADVRLDRLERAIALLVSHQDALCEAMDADYGGRPRLMSKMTDVAASVAALKGARKHLRKWMRRDKRSVRFPLNLLGARAWVEYQPKGVVGVISPWNYPVVLAFSPLAGALAAGNRCMLKPSEHTPETSQLMAELIGAAFDRDEISVFCGGAEVGQAFSGLPFDHLIFTGATSVGRHIMRAAADNLTPVTLELGGKSPTIVGRSANLEMAARRIVLGKMMNAGQTCLAPDYVLVHEAKAEDLTECIRKAATEIYPTVSGNEHYAQIVDDRNAQRLAGYVEELRRHSAQVEQLQPAGDDRRFPLTLVREPKDTWSVMREEIFGPILPIRSFADIDQAIDHVNSGDRPLGLYYFGEDRNEQRRVLDRTISGGVTLNDVIFHITAEDLPFGGIGASGMGCYHGYDGFKTFSHAKAIYAQPRLNFAKLAGLIPPYGKKLEKTIDMDLK